SRRNSTARNVTSLAPLLLPVALAAGALQTPTPRPSAPKPPIFGSDTDLVLVDTTVTDKRDRPVLDLTAADFRVFEDGVERQVQSFAALGAGALRALEKATVAPGQTDASPPPPIPFVPASTVLYIDEGHMTAADADRVRKAMPGIVSALLDRRGAILVLAPFSNVAYGGRLPEDIGLVTEAANHIRARRFEDNSRLPMT